MQAGRQQQPFEELVWLLFQDQAVLESSRFALVGVADQVAWCRRLADQSPFSSARKAGAAHPAQPRHFDFVK
jgi:hypothetical protein